jgi:hypothetical protein
MAVMVLSQLLWPCLVLNGLISALAVPIDSLNNFEDDDDDSGNQAIASNEPEHDIFTTSPLDRNARELPHLVDEYMPFATNASINKALSEVQQNVQTQSSVAANPVSNQNTTNAFSILCSFGQSLIEIYIPKLTN